MPPRKTTAPSTTSTDYRHTDTRLNNPPAGLADVAPLPPGRKRYAYDPHLDPQLQWSGKAEHLTFDVETVPLHIHERISASGIIESLRTGPVQRSMFGDPEFDLNEAVEFYQHPTPWANRLVLGDSLLVMNSLLEREMMAGQVQCVYFDPPYGIKYNVNFQPRTDQRDVQDGEDKSLTREPEQIRAFRDTWELGVHSYLTYIRDRLLLIREMLTDSGSVFMQIGDENVHRIRCVMDEVFGGENFFSIITFKKTGGQSSDRLPGVCDYLLWYCRDIKQLKHRHLFFFKRPGEEGAKQYNWIELPDGRRRAMTPDEINGQLPQGAKVFQPYPLVSMGASQTDQPFVWEGKEYHPSPNRHWSVTANGLARLAQEKRLLAIGNTLRFVNYLTDYPVTPYTNLWTDTQTSGFAAERKYVVQTLPTVIQRCILMATDPGDLVFDPTCGSGTTAYVAEQWGRRWITCDTSRVALALARQRLLTASYPYYRLKHPDQGVRGGFDYEEAEHIMMGSIANNEPASTETLYDRPRVERGVVRVSGPFSVEAVQPPTLDPDAVDGDSPAADDAGNYLDRMVEQLRRAGLTVRGQHIPITRIAPLVGGVLHAECDYEQGGKTINAAVVFGPQYGPVTSMQLQDALNEARGSYSALIAAGFTFDDQAQALLQKENLRPPIIGVAINADLLMGNLLKTSKSSQVFSVFGKPDVRLDNSSDGYTVTVRGVDVYDPNTGEFDQSSADQIAAWFLDTDYDGATFLVSQAYFPTQTPNPWEKISRALRGSIDPDRFEALQRTTSLSFKPGRHRQCAVKVIDHRGNEVMTVLKLT